MTRTLEVLFLGFWVPALLCRCGGGGEGSGGLENPVRTPPLAAAGWQSTPVSADSHRTYSGVRFADPWIGWTCTTFGEIFKTEDGGVNWTLQYSDTGVDWNAVWCSNDSTVWVVGSDGFFARSVDGGSKWTVTKPTDKELYGLHFINNSEGWIVGASGTLLHTIDGGINWSSVTPGADYLLTGTWFVDSENGCAVSQYGILRTSDGGVKWTSPLAMSLSSSGDYDIQFVDSTTGWAVFGNKILHTSDGGGSWHSQTVKSGALVDVKGISCVDAMSAWVVGTNGAVYRTQDGGTTWTQQSSGTTQVLNAVHFVDPSYGWIAGDDVLLRTTTGGQ